MEKPRRDVRALSLDELRRFFTSHSVPAFKGDQVYQWLWSKYWPTQARCARPVRPVVEESC